jgi:hypothetical protein
MAKGRKGSYVGFSKLSARLARQGVRNPNAVAASIGRKKYGKAGMAKKAAAGRRSAGRKRR